MKKSITIADIAKIAHVSSSTVSKALSNSTDISEESRQAIVAIAKENGYVIKNYKKKSKGQILVYVGNIDVGEIGVFGYQVLFGFQSSANMNGYSIWLMNDKNTTDKQLETALASNEYNSVFVMGVGCEDPKLQIFKDSNMPCVLLDNYVESPNMCEVMTDSKLGMVQCVKYLHDLGHENIALFAGTKSSAITIDRKSAFQIEMINSGLTYRSDLVAYGDFFTDTSKELVPTLLQNGATAIMCMSDKIASEVIDTLHEMNLRVPEDISVVGFDDGKIATQTNPPLTTVRQDGVEIGRVAYSSLRQLAKGAKIARVLMRPELIVRKSAGRVGIRKFKF